MLTRMNINKRQQFRWKPMRSSLMTIALAFMVLGYAAKHYMVFSPPYVLVNLSNKYRNVMFTSKTIYFLDGVAYDYYSIDELNNRPEPSVQWKTFPLPNEQIPANLTPWTPPPKRGRKPIPPVNMPPPSSSTTGLAYVDHIYITTASDLTDRQINIEKMFARYEIKNYDWRTKWEKNTCYSAENRPEVFKKLNLRSKSINSMKRRRHCAITMEHVDIWYEIVAQNSSLSLILEDDAIFVPNFREKFNRTIYTAIRTGALKIDGLNNCVSGKPRLSATSREWYEQDPVIFIGGCMDMYDDDFPKNQRNTPPILSTHKNDATRCSHAYLLTACSAQALLNQIAARKTTFLQSDLLLKAQVVFSPTLQSFWLDPPIVYQGNRVNDLDKIPSFKQTTY